MQSANFARELPGYTIRARDQVVDWVYRYNQDFGLIAAGKGKIGFGGSQPGQLAFPSPSPTPGADFLAESRRPLLERDATRLKRSRLRRRRLARRSASASRKRSRNCCPICRASSRPSADKFWNLLKTSIGGFLGVTGFLLSLVMVPIYLFFFLKERPAISAVGRNTCPCGIRR